MHMICVCITHLFHVVSSYHAVIYFVISSASDFHVYFAPHCLKACSLFDTSQGRCKTMCCPSDAKQSLNYKNISIKN